MNLKKLIITSQTAHFGEFLGCDNRRTNDLPPPSTVIGILRVLFGEDIDNFIFGYTFTSETKFLDDITLYKHSNEGFTLNKNKEIATNCNSREYLYNNRLIIYTDIQDKLSMNYSLCLGKSGSIARLHLPIQNVNLITRDGQGFNQFTPTRIGNGVINPTTMVTKFNEKLGVYDQQIKHLRRNTTFNYNKNYDESELQNIFLWKIRNGDVEEYD